MSNNTKKPVTMITGYLGSGKTTLLNELLKSQTKDRLAVVVNDLGSINVDAAILKQNSVVQSELQMIEMTNGCICCTLREEFMRQIEKLSADPGIDKIIVEASGVSNPAAIANGFLSYQQMKGDSNVYLDSVVTVADADRLYTEFIDELRHAADEGRTEDPDIINLVMDQIEFCNTIVLNKCDLLEPEEITEIKDLIRTFQHDAEILEAVNGRVSPDKIFSGRKFDFEKVMLSSAYQMALEREGKMNTFYDDDYGITSFVYKDARPFDYDKFIEFMSEGYPIEITRGKGYMWFKHDDKHIQLFEQAGRNSTVTEVSEWVASMPEEEQKAILKDFPDMLEEWDEKYGDRINQLVFIGKGYDKEKFLRELRDCIAE